MKLSSFWRCAFCFITLVLLWSNANAQFRVLSSKEIENLTELPEQLPENSGIIITPYHTVIGHNDRGGKARLYEFDIKTGRKIRTIEIENAKNKDWEDITSDAKYIYISDTGNNRGKREKLRIYRIPWPEKGSERITVEAEKIKLKYAEQDNFEKRKRHNYDCEAIISLGDSLYLFSKNRADLYTNVHAISKIPGEYVAYKTQTFESKGLITGADVVQNGTDRILALVGYNKKKQNYEPFIWTFSGFENAQFFKGTAARVNLPMHIQVEGVAFLGPKKVLYTNEAEEEGSVAALYQVKTKALIRGQE